MERKGGMLRSSALEKGENFPCLRNAKKVDLLNAESRCPGNSFTSPLVGRPKTSIHVLTPFLVKYLIFLAVLEVPIPLSNKHFEVVNTKAFKAAGDRKRAIGLYTY